MSKNWLGIDVDGSKENFWVSFFKSRRMFPDSKIVAYKTKRGYHIEINKDIKNPLENLKIRAIIGDDAGRIRKSLQRLYLHPNSENYDLLFETKKGNKRRKIDLDKFFERHKSLVRKTKNAFRNGTLENYSNLIKKVARKKLVFE